MHRALCVLAVSLLLVACGDTDGGFDAGPDARVPEARVELGTGTASFEPIPETGGELELVGGPQGGFHVFVTARIYGMDPEGMILRFDATDVGTGMNVGTPAIFALTATRVQREGDHWVRAGDFLILHDSDPDPVRGLMLDITVTAEEAGSGRSAMDNREILVVDNVRG